MALALHSSCLLKKPCFFSPSRTNQFTIRSQESSEPQKPTTVKDPAQPKKPNSTGLGFGSSPSPSSSTSNLSSSGPINKKKQRGKVIRRRPVEKPALVSENEAQDKEQNKNESAFLLTWLGLGLVILIEGIALAASGFLPEEWDKIFVKYVYPSFTPTVFLFVAGTVVYGVLKYLQNENSKS